jgi:prepilin-type N-terminal cleavage/methylation domain-containing protein
VRRNRPVYDAMPRATRVCKPQPGPGRSRGFTLVEVLVVILIVGMLAGLLLPAVMQALTKARNTAIKAEIDMLHMAIMNYKNEYGSFPPCFDPSGYSSAGSASKHLARLFPRCVNPTATGEGEFASASEPITPFTAIVSWLGGYTNNPMFPLTGGDRKRLFDFDQARISPTLSYFPPKNPNSPYIYITSDQYLWDHDNNPTTPPVVRYFPPPGGAYYGHRIPPAGGNNFAVATQPAFNPDTFQILCAGRDGEFGTDDDLSNFWPSTRRAYLDSLNAQ